MKTIKIFMLCLVSVIAFNRLTAQNGVVKSELTVPWCPTDPFCTGEYLCGQFTFDEFETQNGKGWVEKLRNGYAIAYSDAELKHPTGNVYEVLQTDTGHNDWSSAVSTAMVKFHGKVVAIARYRTHTTVNANGIVTVTFENYTYECK